METVNQILLVDNLVTSNSEIDNKVKKHKLANSVKITLNGGHALLYLEQIQERLLDNNMVILLNMNTPIVNGYEFINLLSACKTVSKENILLIVFTDNLNDDDMDTIKSMGINHFTSKDFQPETLKEMIKKHFHKSTSLPLKTKLNSFDQLQGMKAA
jgi:CheY-like chemotaxis protein